LGKLGKRFSCGSMFEKYKWRNRILVVLSDDEKILNKQKDILIKSKDCLIDRDLIIFGYENLDAPFIKGSQVELNSIKEEFSISQDGNVILIGKDGGVKKTWKSYVSSDELFTIIDSMPMRRREMRRR